MAIFQVGWNVGSFNKAFTGAGHLTKPTNSKKNENTFYKLTMSIIT